MLKTTENIRFTGNPINLNFQLEANHEFLGYDQEIDSIVNDTTNSLINDINDSEVRRFHLLSSMVNKCEYDFFFSGKTNGYQMSFINAGFKASEITTTNIKFANSFFIFDFFDTYETDTQTKIFRVYLTNLMAKSKTPSYVIDKKSQIYNWNVPVWYINQNIGKIITGYTRILFYNGTNGKVVPFYNKDKKSLTTPEKMYFNTILDIDKRTWSLGLGIFAYELVSPIYNNRINETVQSLESKKQNYGGATGIFNPATGYYIHDL